MTKLFRFVANVELPSGHIYVPVGDILFDSVLFDLSNNFKMSTGQFVVPKNGFYKFMIDGFAHANGPYADIRLRINGDEYRQFIDYGKSDCFYEINGMASAELEAGDVVNLYNIHGDSTYVDPLTKFTFMGYLLSETGTV